MLHGTIDYYYDYDNDGNYEICIVSMNVDFYCVQCFFH